jgi:hypothetical protein
MEHYMAKTGAIGKKGVMGGKMLETRPELPGREFAPMTVAQLGNLVAGVTIQELNQTGTASPEEILAIGRQQAYFYGYKRSVQPG